MSPVVLLFTSGLLEASALACSVCQDPNDPRAGAYFNMTLFLSLLPIAAMGAIAWWLYRRFQEAEAVNATS